MARTAAAKAKGLKHITNKTSAGETLRRCLAASRQALLRLERQAESLDVDTVHHFRTTIRRVRSLLSSFKDLLPPGERKELSDKLQDLSRRYATLREWDVLIEALTDEAGDREQPKLAAVADAAKRRRAAAARQHPPLRKNIRTVERAIASLPWLNAPSPGEAECWNRPIGAFASDLFDRQRRQMQKRARGLDLSDPASFHKFRIAAKKHRYAIEYLAPLYGKKARTDYLDQVVAIQDVLGDMRDALTARALVAQLELPPASRALARRWLERRGADFRKRFPASEKAFRREDSFWE